MIDFVTTHPLQRITNTLYKKLGILGYNFLSVQKQPYTFLGPFLQKYLLLKNTLQGPELKPPEWRDHKYPASMTYLFFTGHVGLHILYFLLFSNLSNLCSSIMMFLYWSSLTANAMLSSVRSIVFLGTEMLRRGRGVVYRFILAMADTGDRMYSWSWRVYKEDNSPVKRRNTIIASQIA